LYILWLFLPAFDFCFLVTSHEYTLLAGKSVSEMNYMSSGM